jgi:DDE_Tnp_1-associated
MEAIWDEEMPRSRVAVLLEHFSQIEDGREPWRVAYPLAEVLLLLTCATIADCDDFDEIVAWGELHLDFLRRFAPFHFGIPCARWLRMLVNRLDPVLFGSCFESWIRELWPGRHDLIAIDGKTSPHPRQAQGDQSAPYPERLCDQCPAGPGATQRARENQ